MLSEIRQSQMFWYMRVCALTTASLERHTPEDGCWRRAWYLLNKVTKQRWTTSEALQLVLHDELSVQILLDLSREADAVDLEQDSNLVGTSRRLRVLEFGSDDEIWRHPSVKYERVFSTACRSGYTNTVRLILETGYVNPSADEDDALFWTVVQGHAGIVRLLLAQPSVDPTRHYSKEPNFEECGTLLTIASRRGHVEVVKALLEDGRVDPRDKESECLSVASWVGNVEVVQALLEDGRAEPDWNTNYMLVIAADDGDVDVTRMLLKDGRVDPTIEDNSTLQIAIDRGHIEIERLLRADSRVATSWTGD